MRISDAWQDYECLDAINGEKLERWKDIILIRPEPQAIWPGEYAKVWKSADGHYHRSSNGGGSWEFKKNIAEDWKVSYKNLTFKVKPTNFKHTGLFPEQATNWDFIMDKIKKSNRPIKVLNLFAYTGAATMAAASSGASEVVHVDSSKGINEWAKENMVLSHLENHKIRFITDDCLKFVKREIRRGNKYDAIIMDPPSYGRGPSGEMWKLENNLNDLVKECILLLSDKPLFFLINAYTTGLSHLVLANLLNMTLSKTFNGCVDSGEVGLPITTNNLILPCGIYARWQSLD